MVETNVRQNCVKVRNCEATVCIKMHDGEEKVCALKCAIARMVGG
jgi:hypothetical protein